MDEYICIGNYKKVPFKIIKKIAITILVVSLIILGFVYLINPIIISTAEIESKKIATRAINNSIADVVLNTILYEDLVNIISDEFGNISMIQANSLQINNLSKDLSITCENKIVDYGKVGIDIPIGSFTGLSLLVGRGPKINVKLTPIGSVICKFISKFENAGINQTLHKIYVEVCASIGVVVPFNSRVFENSEQILISESVIVGQVPEVYLYSDSLDTLLNFVPY